MFESKYASGAGYGRVLVGAKLQGGIATSLLKVSRIGPHNCQAEKLLL